MLHILFLFLLWLLPTPNYVYLSLPVFKVINIGVLQQHKMVGTLSSSLLSLPNISSYWSPAPLPSPMLVSLEVFILDCYG